MITPSPETHSEYWVVFTQGVTHWVTRWLKPNFSHIFIVTRDDFNWVILNPTRLYLQLLIPAEVAETDVPSKLIQPCDTVLKITFTRRDDTRQYGFFGPLNCVTWAKYILGIRIWCLTPFGLYKRLVTLSPARKLRHGIVSIEGIKDDRSRPTVEPRAERPAES
jgi:hypothetical protein